MQGSSCSKENHDSETRLTREPRDVQENHLRFKVYGITAVIYLSLVVLGLHDVDYDVFTDASRAIWNAKSPYSRHTYRYTPLLALFTLPNLWFWPFGKLVFVALAFCCAYRIEAILRWYSCPSRWSLWLPVLIWLWNPIVLGVCCRGSADVASVYLTLEMLHAIVRRRITCAAISYGIAVHFKIYPVVFGPGLLLLLHPLYLNRTNRQRLFSIWDPSTEKIDWRRLLLLPKRLVWDLPWHLIYDSRWEQWYFGLVSLAVFFTLGIICWLWLGYPFVYESYIYHLVRRDHRHNFSPFFYLQYLSYHLPIPQNRWLFWIRPQFLLTEVLTLRFTRRAPGSALFLASLAFVTLNKVVTSQYFLWYLGFAPLVIWDCARLCTKEEAPVETTSSSSGSLTRNKGSKGNQVLPAEQVSSKERAIPVILWRFAKYLVLWLAAQACWLVAAGGYEIYGKNTFREMAVLSIIFLLVNIRIIAVVCMYLVGQTVVSV